MFFVKLIGETLKTKIQIFHFQNNNLIFVFMFLCPLTATIFVIINIYVHTFTCVIIIIIITSHKLTFQLNMNTRKLNKKITTQQQIITFIYYFKHKSFIRGTNKFVRFCKRWRNYCLIPPFRIYKYALESCH